MKTIFGLIALILCGMFVFNLVFGPGQKSLRGQEENDDDSETDKS